MGASTFTVLDSLRYCPYGHSEAISLFVDIGRDFRVIEMSNALIPKEGARPTTQ
jgi:hypothetical protein